jgi:amino acid adenylation domain-containing protein
VRAECLDVFDHQHVPVQAIINEIHPQRTANHVGLVQVLFQLRNLPAVVDTFGDARVETLDVNAGALIAELEVDVVDDGRCLTIRCEHSRAVFDSETVERLLERFECLLRDAVRCPDAPIGRLALLPSGERALLDRFGTGAPQAAPTATVPELVAERTASCAEAIAVRAAGAGITYGELERHIRALDRWLRGRGVRRGDSVGVALRREPVLVATIQALWRIGAMVVPIDPAWPSARIAVVVDDADVVMVLANREITSTFADLRVLAIEDATCSSTEGTGDPPTEAEPTVDATLDDSAYIEFTSGSTGRPKAVEVSHRSLASYCEAHRALTGLGGHDIVLASTPLTFDPAIDQLVLPLAAGAQIMIADDREYTDPAAVAALLDTGLPTVLGPTPSFLAAVVAAGWRARDTLTIWSGGEVLPPPLAATVLPRSGRLLNVYGPTETTVWATGYELTDADIDSGRSIPIGAPLAGARCIVVDARGEPSPIGVPGELLIAGERVAIGYRNQPEQTAVAFVDRDDPFDGVHRRWYRTGDQIRWRPDGALEYVGRTDSQLKVRGVRLEAAEVEAAIVTHPGVEAAAVAVRGEQLIGFYVASSRQSGAAPTPAELRGHVSDLLPSGMVPSRFVELDALPLTNSRKVDRRSLPALAESEAGRGREPSTPTEVALASMWREVLHVDHVGADDEFFEIGGHSLLVIQLFGMIEAQLGRRLPLSQIFATPTLVDLAHAVDDAADEPDTKMRLVPMRDGAGSSAALFLVPGAGGTALVFQHAVSQLRADGRVFAVEFGRVGAMSIEDRAALALPAIVDAAAGQPFIVGGYSFGGKVAFEIARQAAQSGVSCRLVIVDTPAPQAGPARQARGAARSAANAARRGLRPLRPRARDSADAVEAAELTAAQHWQRMQKAQGNANMAALRRYRPPRGAPLTAVVIASDASIKTHGDRTLWWRRYVSGTIEVRSISLDHPRLGDLRVQSEIGAILDDLIESHIQK